MDESPRGRRSQRSHSRFVQRHWWADTQDFVANSGAVVTRRPANATFALSAPESFSASGTWLIVQSVTKTPKPPYTSVSDVDAFFERVQTIAEPRAPKKVDSGWVESYQFDTAHPSAIPSMLRWLNVIDEDGGSTGVWDDLRVDGTRETTLARLIKDAYSAVFEAVVVENASARDLRGAFVSAYSIGDPGRHIKCFLALCRHAGISTLEEATARESEQRESSSAKLPSQSTTATTLRSTARSPKQRSVVPPQGGSALNVTLNVEIPAAWTEGQIRERVAAIARALEPSEPSDS